jgi:dTDP-glucose pyrophosphorylase
MNKTSVIIPAAGMASRMRPLSNGISKCMVPVNGKPIISYIIDPLIKNPEINKIVIVQSNAGDVEEFISRVYEKDIHKFKFVIQEKKLGPLHAIYLGWINCLDANTNNDSILVWLGDTIVKDDLEFLSKDFLMTSEVPDWNRWCLVDSDNNFYDKPVDEPPTNEALIGVYNFADGSLFNSAIPAAMKDPLTNNEHQISSLLKRYSKQKKFEIVSTDKWYDCGELNTYHQSKARLISSASRDFNSLDVDLELGILNKSSASNPEKVNREAYWYKNLTLNQSLFAPRYLGQESNGQMSMTWEPGSTLADMWVYENLKDETRILIIERIISVLKNHFHNKETISLHSKGEKDCASLQMFRTKNIDRIEKFSHFPDYNNVWHFVSMWGTRLAMNSEWVECIHGDPHLGNILYEPVSGKLNFVDPRGHFGGIVGKSGDPRYDMAKLTQDIFGGYMHIMSGYYEYDTATVTVRGNPEDSDLLLKHIEILKENGYDPREIFALSIILLVTCIPFHSDSEERQLVLWTRGITLIRKFKELVKNENI